MLVIECSSKIVIVLALNIPDTLFVLAYGVIRPLMGQYICIVGM